MLLCGCADEPGMDLSVHWGYTWGCTPESTRDAPRNALELHPGDAATRHPASLSTLVGQIPFNLAMWSPT